MAKGRKRNINVKRTPSGRASRAADNAATGAEAVSYAVYFVSSNDRVKVGYTSNLGARIATIESNSGFPAELLGAIQIGDQALALELEAGLHEELTRQGRHIRGEWFRLSRADVSSLLRVARLQSHRTTGGDDATADVPILSSLAYASENILPITSLQEL
jgi:hypothetical protein